MKIKHISQLIAGFIISLFTVTSFAFTNEVTLDFQDAHIKGNNVILLKKALKDQYPHLDLYNQHLKNVVVVGKSKHGHGKVSMRINDWISSPETVAGNKRKFRRHANHSFDYVTLENQQTLSSGRWQLLLKGNFKIRKVILVMEDNRLASRSWWQPMSAHQAPHKLERNYRSSSSMGKHSTRQEYFAYH